MGLRNSEQRTKEFDDPQFFDNPKGISIGSMDFDNPKVFGDTSITDGLVPISNNDICCETLTNTNRK